MLWAIPKLAAEEALEGVTRTAAGSGAMKPGDQKAMGREWRRAAGRERFPRRGAPLPSKVAGAMGIAVIREPRKPKQ